MDYEGSLGVCKRRPSDFSGGNLHFEKNGFSWESFFWASLRVWYGKIFAHNFCTLYAGCLIEGAFKRGNLAESKKYLLKIYTYHILDKTQAKVPKN